MEIFSNKPKNFFFSRVVKLFLLLTIFIHSAAINLSFYDFFDLSWIEKKAPSFHVLPYSFQLLANSSNISLYLFFAVAEILLIFLWLVFIDSLFINLMLIYFFSNLKYCMWAILDGGNNLTQIFIIYSLLFVNFKWSKKITDISHQIALFLFKAQVVVLYFCAVLSKSQGALWQNGTALFYIFQNDYFTNSFIQNLIITYPQLSVIGVYSVFIFQFLFVFFTFKSTLLRNLLLIAGVFFHISIALTMNLHFFGMTMILLYCVFFNEKECQKIWTYLFPDYKIFAISFNQKFILSSFLIKVLSFFRSRRIDQFILTDKNIDRSESEKEKIYVELKVKNIDDSDIIFHNLKAISPLIKGSIFNFLYAPFLFIIQCCQIVFSMIRKHFKNNLAILVKE